MAPSRPSTPEPQYPQDLILPATPSAPKFGSLFDDWRPYPTRTSARLAAKAELEDPFQPRRAKSAPRTAAPTFLIDPPAESSLPSCTLQDPFAEEAIASDTEKLGFGLLGAEDDVFTPSSSKLILPKDSTDPFMSWPTPTRTPSRLPKRRPISDEPPQLRTPRSSRYGGLESMRPTKPSFHALNRSLGKKSKFQVYVDSDLRAPEVDTSDDNPFYTSPVSDFDDTESSSEPPLPPTESEEDRKMMKAVKNNEGVIYVFRGKKMFRPIVDEGRHPVEEDPFESQLSDRFLEIESDCDEALDLSSKSVARVLFPTARSKTKSHASSSKPDISSQITPQSVKLVSKSGSLLGSFDEAVDCASNDNLPSTSKRATRQPTLLNAYPSMTPKKKQPQADLSVSTPARSTRKLSAPSTPSPMKALTPMTLDAPKPASPFTAWRRVKSPVKPVFDLDDKLKAHSQPTDNLIARPVLKRGASELGNERKRIRS